MPDKIMPGPVEDLRGIREAVCIHTRKIYDSCREQHGAVLKIILKQNPKVRSRGRSLRASSSFL